MPLFSSYTLRNGDLYKLSNLKEFKIKKEPCNFPQKNDAESNIDLYLLGDSFGEMLSSDVFNNIRAYNYIHWNDKITLPLKTDRKNVLILECVERNLVMRYSNPVDMDNIIVNPSVTHTKLIQDYKVGLSAYFKLKAEQNLNQLLFQDPVSAHFKELKAAINQKWFNRIDPGVVLSSNGQFLFLKETVDSSSSNINMQSSFRPIADSIVLRIVNTLNEVAAHYKTLGFDEVIFAPLPNKVSLAEPGMGKYNELIKRILSHPKLSVTSIDAFEIFKGQAETFYYRNDTHWNCEGVKRWGIALNNILIKNDMPRK